MSVLIKGMKMPEKCGSCDLFHVESPMHCTVVKGHKTVGAPYGMPRPDWCPLIEIPEHIKQGELIRCKDCKHYEWMSNRIPEEQTWHCHCWDADTGKDDFCSYAERRTDD